jgi:hypothetical protein
MKPRAQQIKARKQSKMTTTTKQSETADASQNDAKIQIEINETHVFTRWPCVICGGWTEKDNIESTFKFGCDYDEFVCEECLDAGPAQFKERLLAHAHGRERHAAYLRELAEHEFIVPTKEEYQRLRNEIDERWRNN